MSHWIVVPILLPALAAALLVLLGGRLALQRSISIVATLALLGVTSGLAIDAAAGEYRNYALGDWPAPFGIVIVLDRLAAIMLLVTAVVAAGSLAFALNGTDARGRYFHPLFQFQLMGLNGAFLTGDLFNLFVFFEVLLIASYGLLLHGGGAQRVKAGVHYVVINLAGSALFLFGVSLLYAMTGTLNMADMAVKVAAATPPDAALIRAGGLLMIVVFGVKAAIVPFYFWLPSTYAAASAPVASLFAVMTKLGVYAILRFSTLIFGAGAGVGGDLAQPWLLPAGLATLALATLGTLAAPTLKALVGYCTIASVGTLLVGIGLFREAAAGAAVYYLIHSSLVIALLFLLAELIARGRGHASDRFEPAKAVPQPLLLGGLFFVAAIAVAGVPPLSGFLGKLLLLQAAQEGPETPWIWAVVLVNAFFTLIALARAGSMLFWRATAGPAAAPGARARAGEIAPIVALLGCILALTLAAEPLTRYATAATAQLLHPAGYVQGVLGDNPGGTR